MIIDVHTHLNNYHESEVRSIDRCLDNLHESMDANGVDYALVLTSYKVTENRPSTRQVVEATHGIDDIAVVAGISFLNYRLHDLIELGEYLSDGLVKGLKLYPGYEPFYPYDSRLKVVYDLAIEHGVPVMIHCGDTYTPKGKLRFSHPLNVDDVAVDYPDLKLVICHLGNPWIRDCMEVTYKNANVYADVSGLVLGSFKEHFEEYMAEQVRDMIVFAGEPDYLLYGSDWPICEMGSYLKFMRSLGLPEESYAKIMWKNATRVFPIDLDSADK